MGKTDKDLITLMCGARAKRSGNPCQLYPCKNGRCHLHGGKSTGPKTTQGKARIKQANTKHGFFTKEAISERRGCREFIRGLRDS